MAANTPSRGPDEAIIRPYHPRPHTNDGRRTTDDDGPRRVKIKMKNNVGIRVCKKVGDSGGMRYLAQRCIAFVSFKSDPKEFPTFLQTTS